MCLAQGPQRSDAGEARTRGPSVSSQTLNHWATALPTQNMIEIKTQWAHKCGPLSARQRNTFETAFRWRVDSGPLSSARMPWKIRRVSESAHAPVLHFPDSSVLELPYLTALKLQLNLS